MPVTVEYQRSGKEEHKSEQQRHHPPEMSLEEVIAHQSRDEHPCHTHALHIYRHIHARHKVSRQIQRICHTVICKVVDILSSSELHSKIRVVVAGLEEAHTDIFRYHKMLAAPIHIRTPCHASAQYKQIENNNK